MFKNKAHAGTCVDQSGAVVLPREGMPFDTCGYCTNHACRTNTPVKLAHCKSVASFVSNVSNTTDMCVLCKSDKHPLFVCPKFKSLPHEQMVSTIKEHSLCMNCLRLGHFVKHCESLHHYRKCQKPHHTLLHMEQEKVESPPDKQHVVSISSSMASGVTSNTLLMTCRVYVEAPDKSTVEARALLDSGSSASFISERLANSLSLPRSTSAFLALQGSHTKCNNCPMPGSLYSLVVNNLK